MATVIYFVPVLTLKTSSNVLALLLGALLGWFANQQFSTTSITPAVQSTQIITQPAQVVKSSTELLSIPVASTPEKSPVVIDNYAPEYLMRQSQTAIKNADYQQALIHIENLLAQVQDRYPWADIEQMFIKTVRHYLAQLGDNNIAQKINILNKAIDVLPNELQFHYQLAQLFLALKDYSQAQYELSFLVNNSNWKSQFDKLQAQLYYAQIFQQGDIEIPLIKLTNVWHIEVFIDGAPARFILDTGASVTVVSDALIAPNYQRLGKITLSTANGTLEAFKVAVKTLLVGGISKNSFPVVVLPATKLPADVDGLLGLDWLANFDFVIDKKNAVLRLTPVVN